MCSAIRLSGIVGYKGHVLRSTHNTRPKQHSHSGVEKFLPPRLIWLRAERFEIALHAIQPVHAVLEPFGQTAKERGHMAVLELVEGTDDPVRLLAGFHV